MPFTGFLKYLEAIPYLAKLIDFLRKKAAEKKKKIFFPLNQETLEKGVQALREVRESLEKMRETRISEQFPELKKLKLGLVKLHLK
jgi:DNA anti-recombination protein RmuC